MADERARERDLAAFAAHDAYEGGGFMRVGAALVPVLAACGVFPRTLADIEESLQDLGEDVDTPLGSEDFARLAAHLRAKHAARAVRSWWWWAAAPVVVGGGAWLLLAFARRRR